MARDEPSAGRSARIEPLKLHLRDENVCRAVKIDDVAPPAAARTLGLCGVHEHRIDAHTADAHIIDRALGGPELRPRALPRIAELHARLGARCHDDWSQKHRHRTPHLPVLNAKELRRPSTIEEHAEIGDVAVWPDLLALDVDRANDLV